MVKIMTKGKKECKHKFTDAENFSDMVCVRCGKTYLEYISPKLAILSKELDKISSDPEVLARGEELERLMRPTWEEVNRPFNI